MYFYVLKKQVFPANQKETEKSPSPCLLSVSFLRSVFDQKLCDLDSVGSSTLSYLIAAAP